MTVIVKYDENGKPQYRSAKGIGSTEDERLRARRLDSLLKKNITNFAQQLARAKRSSKVAKGDVDLYWDLGDILQKVFNESGLIDPSEKHLYWLNARIYVPDELMAKDRGPHRLHLAYCFRLAGFPKNEAVKMKWGEWVYLFDSPGVNRELRFDRWLKEKMASEPEKFSRKDVRIFVQSANQLLGDKDTKDLTDEQLRRCYDAAWLIKEKFQEVANKVSNNIVKDMLRSGIKKNYTVLGDVIDGTKSASEFAKLVAKEIP
ncbi:MAG: hypothetical protein C3F07_15620 [Anaerolineales bacterium]|nr:MAG: hypothetical protein C3F07_15620 [Anaerolineales bacterium]